MQNKPLHAKPAYHIESVDRALLLIQLLRDMGSIRLKDAAEELGVAPSTAHRLLGMLVYRDFVIQDESRIYHPGPAMGVGPAGLDATRELRAIALPQMEVLAGHLGETVNLVIRVGTKVRFIATVEGTNLLRVGNRQGTVLPASKTSSGKALLAELERETLDLLFRSSNASMSEDRIGDDEYSPFLAELKRVRQRGFAINRDSTESGISAVGIALHDSAGIGVGALSVSMPTARLKPFLSERMVDTVHAQGRRIERNLLMVRS